MGLTTAYILQVTGNSCVYRAMLAQSAVMRLHVVCLSVCLFVCL